MENAQDNNSTFQFIGEEKETQNTENKEQSKIEHNNIIEKPQAQEAKGQARKEVSESSLISLLNGGNKVVWEDKEQGLFSYNGRQFKVIWNQQAIAETPATTSGNAEKGRIPLKRPEMPF